MIYRVYSDLPKFKDIDLSPGLNILLAETTPGSTERQTRNRAGKSSFVEVVHFLLGSKGGPDSLFRIPELVNARFGLELDVGSERVTVERSGAKHGTISLLHGSAETWPVPPAVNRRSGERTLPASKWKSVLAKLWFGLDPDQLREELGRYTPTFRSLISYYARRESAGGFIEPVSQSRRQLTWDQQVATTFLLGLDWTVPQRLQQVRDRERALQELRSAAQSGAFGALLSSTAELRTRVTVAEDRVNRLRTSLQSFRVLPQYRELEQEASALTRRLSDLSDQNSLDRQLVIELREALSSEAPPPVERLWDLYESANVQLGEAVRTRFDEVRSFHESVVRNRRNYLEGEIEALETAIENRLTEMHVADTRRAEIMTILSSHGALESYFELQSEFSKAESRAEELRQRFAAAEQLEGQKTELEIERRRIFRRLQQDFHEQADVLKDAILTFESVSEQLYEEAGHLTISASSNGPQFDVTIQGERSKGVTNMQIFCFDMMLMSMTRRRGSGPGFLIHDSHLFDGVDERQRAQALRIGRDLAAEHDFQYIVTMNSDDVPTFLPHGFDIEEHVLPVRLTDAEEDGGLFGFRFG